MHTPHKQSGCFQAGPETAGLLAQNMSDSEPGYRRSDLERLLREAVLGGRFVLHYQPVFRVVDRRLVGFEALIRLPAGDAAFVPPAQFIPVAEDMGLMSTIGGWVLRQACSAASGWPDDLTIAVNISPSQLVKDDVIRMVFAALNETGVSAHRLELEITESMRLANSAEIVTGLYMMRSIGVGIALDDFGAGYSNLGYLLQFPFTKMKIDRSLIEGVEHEDATAKIILESVIALGRRLEMRVTVEGVETARQAEAVRGAGGDLVQGFHFGRPVPANHVREIILQEFGRARCDPARKMPGGASAPSSLRTSLAARALPRRQSDL